MRDFEGSQVVFVEDLRSFGVILVGIWGMGPCRSQGLFVMPWEPHVPPQAVVADAEEEQETPPHGFSAAFRIPQPQVLGGLGGFRPWGSLGSSRPVRGSPLEGGPTLGAAWVSPPLVR